MLLYLFIHCPVQVRMALIAIWVRKKLNFLAQQIKRILSTQSLVLESKERCANSVACQ